MKIGEAEVELVLRPRVDVYDPLVIVVYWMVMVFMGAAIGLLFGAATW